MLNDQGRPSAADATNKPVDTFTGNRGLQIEEALLFEIGRHDVTVLNDTFFNEFTIRVPGDAAHIVERLALAGVLGGVPVSRLEHDKPELADLIVIASTEINTDADRAEYVRTLKEIL